VTYCACCGEKEKFLAELHADLPSGRQGLVDNFDLTNFPQKRLSGFVIETFIRICD
jgi:hypothetical protein